MNALKHVMEDRKHGFEELQQEQLATELCVMKAWRSYTHVTHKPVRATRQIVNLEVGENGQSAVFFEAISVAVLEPLLKTLMEEHLAQVISKR